jgi:uncharacterized membrane protein YhaH (DUF805 family)
MRHFMGLWFGVHEPVGRKEYLMSGIGLMVLKYGVDSLLIKFLTGEFLSPLAYAAPLITAKQMLLELGTLPLLGLSLWTLVFVWIGAGMTIRRLRDAGRSPWLSFFFFLPFLNYFAMLAFAALPSAAAPARSEEPVPSPLDSPIWSALAGALAGSAIAVSITLFAVFVLSEYGLTLFFGAPFVMGFSSSAIFNSKTRRSGWATAHVALLSVAIGGALLMLMALEGLLCLAMAAPIALILSLMGAFLARGLAMGHPPAALLVLLLPLLAMSEPRIEPPLHRVTTSIHVDAPPEEVWKNVIGFSRLPEPARWFFELGVAYPIQARLEGEGVGAVRYCEFSTGPFVEPVTHWEPPKRLGFSVSSQPPTMEEWSPYERVNAPHLTESLHSRRGEFLLLPDPEGGTLLQGSTWYTLAMEPQFYWSPWSDWLIHAIHQRVLAHIKNEAERR